MIKRAGATINSVTTRTKSQSAINSTLAKETLVILKNKSYVSPLGNTIDIESDLVHSIDNTKLYTDLSNIPVQRRLGTAQELSKPVIEVINETTSQAATRLLKQNKDAIVALNFAAARNPGGGFLSGAIAQEEDLCRSSGLYSCLKSKPLFYNKNILCEDAFYTDDIIYSPDVPFFRNDDHVLLEQPYNLSIISSPAPNLNGTMPAGWQALLKGIINERALKILDIAALHGHKNIILGAWGCGAFGNDPVMVATIVKETLKRFDCFEHIAFPVYDTRPGTTLFNTFKEILLSDD